MSPLRIACVQYDVKLGDLQANLDKIQHLTQDLKAGQVDLLVFPETCLSGYCFDTPQEIKPYLEDGTSGPTTKLAISLALKLKCHVIAGYPEAAPSNGAPGHKVGWNSAVIVNPDGAVVGNTRKTLLYETDKIWALEGDGFKHFDLPAPLGRIAIPICMDINTKDFIGLDEDFSIANYCLENQVDIVVIPMAWHTGGTVGPYPLVNDPDLPATHKVKYWQSRFKPFLDTGRSKIPILVTSGMVGTQKDTTFCGSSCVMRVKKGEGVVPYFQVVDTLNQTEEAVLLSALET